MKLRKVIIGVVLFLSLLLLSSTTYAQNVYPQFSELRGMEDQSGNTQLFYRIYSCETGSYYSADNDIYRFDVLKKKDTIFIYNGIYNYPYIEGGYLVDVYQFWKNDYTKFIYSYAGPGNDVSSSMRRFDGEVWNIPAGMRPQKIFISNQNDSLLYTDGNGKSTDGGWNWFRDTLLKAGVVALSPLNDSILFFRDSNYNLFKTINRGLTSYIVDTSKSWTRTFNFSNDGKHVFRVDPVGGEYVLYSSSNTGELGSWSTLLASDKTIFISLDDINKKLYAASGKNIVVYDYAGNLTTENYRMKKTITGLYKKPGTDKLYVQSLYEIDEITPQTITVLKQIPVSPEYAQWHPLAVGNTWVYQHESYPASSYKSVITVIDDTLMPSGLRYFKVFREDSASTSTRYQRYDTLSGNIIESLPGWERILYNTYVDVGDSLWASGEYSSEYPIVFSDEGYTSSFGKEFMTRNFNTTNLFGNKISYQMKKEIGITACSIAFETCGFISDKLLACRINGVSFGDTVLLGVQPRNSVLPSEYILHQNYPNPFNPSTRITYALPAAGNISLNIYSITGALVAMVADGYQSAGNHSVEFNAKGLASGMYIYRLSAGSFVQNKKMIILK